MNRITVKTTVQADLEKVWNYWTKPEHITNWNFATDEWCCPNVENDLTPKGNCSWRMEAKDGSMGFDFTGTYDKVVDKKLISYKMSDGRTVDIEFTEKGEEIEVSETFDAEGTNSDEQQRAGWQAILGNFKKYVESKKKNDTTTMYIKNRRNNSKFKAFGTYQSLCLTESLVLRNRLLFIY